MVLKTSTFMTVSILIFLFLLSSILSASEINHKLQVIGDLPDQYSIICPLGWSKNGHFAFILQDVNPLGGASIYAYNVIIQDMKTDKIMWRKDIVYNLEDNTDTHYGFNWQDLPDNDNATAYNETLWEKVVWPKHQLSILHGLRKFGIKRQNIKIQDIARLSKKGFKIKEDKKFKENCIIDYTLDFFKVNKGKKQVYRYKRKKNKDNSNCQIWYRNFKIMGFIESPFEKRIALIVFKIENGYEEPFEFPFLVGADLQKGFKKF